jgi:two-component system, OmpR family, response regulator MprA
VIAVFVCNKSRLLNKSKEHAILNGVDIKVAIGVEVSSLKILIIEDDVNIARLIELELGYEGYQVAVAHEGNQGLDLFKKDQPDLVLLDVMLPGLDGVEVCKRLRTISKVPVIMLTAKDGVGDRVAGLDSGADDYLTKPFATEELLARIRAVMRRKPQEGILTYADLWMDQLNRVVKRGERQLDLRAKEFDLLRLFMQYPEQVLSREFIFDKVWGYDFIGESNVIEVYIRYLRSKLEDGNSKRLIQTVRGEGYVLREEEPSR